MKKLKKSEKPEPLVKKKRKNVRKDGAIATMLLTILTIHNLPTKSHNNHNSRRDHGPATQLDHGTMPLRH